MKNVTVSAVSGLKYQQTITAGGHTVVCDLEVVSGGNGGGPDPKELVLGGLGSCIAMTIVMEAPRRKWDIQSMSIKVTQTDEADPANPGKKRLVISEDISVQGNLSQQELDDIRATAQKCPVYKLLTAPKRMETLITHVSSGSGTP